MLKFRIQSAKRLIRSYKFMTPFSIAMKAAESHILRAEIALQKIAPVSAIMVQVIVG